MEYLPMFQRKTGTKKQLVTWVLQQQVQVVRSVIYLLKQIQRIQLLGLITTKASWGHKYFRVSSIIFAIFFFGISQINKNISDCLAHQSMQ